MLEIGSLVDGKYKILRVVGKGGMSVVYQAVNEKANKIWAIKEVRKDGVQNFEVVKQNLVVETELLKRFNHPNLPSIIDVIDTDDSFLIVMDYIEGNSLSKAIETSGAQSQEDVIEWSKQLCDVLGYLHSRKPPIIYRDMKPANVMLKPDGNVSLIDFGTAREFKSSSVEDTTCLGTQGYAAPEQYGGHGQTDARTDIYCLGATMYHLVTGHNPSTPPYEMYPIRQWNPMLSSGLEEIITKCTQRNPNDRYQSCAELLYALDHFQDLDIENKKVQSFKWKTFIASVSVMLALVLGMFGFKIAENSATAQTYEGYIAEAEDVAISPSVQSSSTDGAEKYKEAVDLYKLAIATNPERKEAYEAIIKLYMNDSVLSNKEYVDLNASVFKGVYDSNGNYIKTSDALLAGNKEGYAELMKMVADDIFFCYESGFETGITTSEKYYKNAKENTSSNKLDQDIARFQMIADAYLHAGQMTPTGELSGTDPQEVYYALDAVIDSVSESNNIVISLKCYTFISDLLINKVDMFIAGKVSEQDYNAMLDKLSTKLSEIESSELYNANKSVLSESMATAKGNVVIAKQNGYGKSDSQSVE